MNITIKYSQTKRVLVFNSRLWILLSLLVSHPSRHYISYFFFLRYICIYVWLNKQHSWHMLGRGSAGKFYFLSLLVNQLAQQPSSLFWCHAGMSLQFTRVHSFAWPDFGANFSWCWCLQHNIITAANLQRFASSYDRRRFTACCF